LDAAKEVAVFIKKIEVKIEVKDLMGEFRKHGLIYETKNQQMARQSLREVSQFKD
jgi:hypothetical protein